MLKLSRSAALLCAGAFLLTLIAAEGALTAAGFDAAFRADVSYPPGLDTTANFFARPYRLRTNGMGFRYRNIPSPKPAGETRVAVIGDSVIDGVGMREGLTTTQFLEHFYRMTGKKVRFMNFAVAGAGPHEYETVLERYITHADADAVLLVIYANDLADMPQASLPDRPILKRIARRFFPRIYTLFQKAAIRRQWLDMARKMAAIERAGSGGVPLPDEWMTAVDIDTPASELGWKRFEETFRRMRDFCAERDLPLWTVYVPHPHQYDPEYQVQLPAPFVQRERWLSGRSRFQERLENLCAGLSVPFFDMTGSLRSAQARSSAPLNFRFDQHWNARGHYTSAAAIYGWLERLNRLSIARLSGEPNTSSLPSGS